jgi:RNA polymerase sigma factor (TIGR02999 family)
MPDERVTEVLAELRQGAPGARDELFRMIYGELHRVAGAQMRQETPDHTLTPTALVHETYLRLLGTSPDWNDRSHFLAAAARAMRSILVDCARSRTALKRGGGRRRVTLDPDAHAGGRPWEEILAIHEAVDRLQEIDPEGANVVELRFFGGLNVEETALVLGISEAGIYRSWEFARMWLYREIGA